MNEREAIRAHVARIAGGRPVRWTDERTSRGDFEERAWTLEIFDVPRSEWRSLQHRLWEMKKRVWEHMGQSITLVFHTPEETTRLYPWARRVSSPPMIDSARPGPVRVSITLLTGADSRRHARDIIPSWMHRPKVA